MAESGSLLVLNAGSSSLKFALFDSDHGLTATARGEVTQIHSAPHLQARDAAGTIIAEQSWQSVSPPDTSTLVQAVLAVADTHLGAGGLKVAGHRIVHGGARHAAPERITPTLLAALEALTPLDPLHMPDNLAPIHAIAACRPDLPQIACFDTAFHRTMPAVATQCALPRTITDKGVRRYGFHGLSYEYIAARLAKDAPALARGRVIVAHLGSGASLCAVQGGKSIATTFGFSVLDGLVMATRCGRLDPGIIFYLARQGLALNDIEDMLYHRSGLLGVSGISGDVRALLECDDTCAHEALELYLYRMACEAGGLVCALQGLDGLIFTAGVGEHVPAIRAGLCARLGWLGVRIDADANNKNAMCISTPESAVDVRVIPTDEEAVIAQHSWQVLMAA